MAVAGLGLLIFAGCGDGKADPKVRGTCIVEQTLIDLLTREETFSRRCRNDISKETCAADAFNTRSSRRETDFMANTTCAEIGFEIPCGTAGFVNNTSDC